jgi:hypothetical protein
MHGDRPDTTSTERPDTDEIQRAPTTWRLTPGGRSMLTLATVASLLVLFAMIVGQASGASDGMLLIGVGTLLLLWFVLGVYYLSHLVSNPNHAPATKTLWALGILLVPPIAMPLYLWIEIRDVDDPAWRRLHPRK